MTGRDLVDQKFHLLGEDRHLVHLSLQDRRLTSSQLKRQWEDTCGIVCSSRTVRKKLDNVGLHGRVAKKKPLLTECHKMTRLNWAKERKNWSLADGTKSFGLMNQNSTCLVLLEGLK